MAVFRLAEEKDAPLIAALRRRSWEAAYRGIFQDELLDEYDYQVHTARVLTQIRDPAFHVYVIEDDDRPVGFLMFSRQDPPIYKRLSVCLNALYLVPEAFCQGIGRQAVALVADWCREHGESAFFLSCSLHNQRARAFYEAMGGIPGRIDGGHADRGADTLYYEFNLGLTDLPVRKRNRLKSFDYSENGAYFVTVCTKDKQKLFWNVGAIINRPPDRVHLSLEGRIVDQAIRNIEIHYPGIHVDISVVMPNHVHLLLTFTQHDIGAQESGRLIIAPTSLSTVIQQFKRTVSKQLGYSPWQKSFHDHVIRNQTEYNMIWQYIDQNPENWKSDCFFIDS